MVLEFGRVLPRAFMTVIASFPISIYFYVATLVSHSISFLLSPFPFLVFLFVASLFLFVDSNFFFSLPIGFYLGFWLAGTSRD